MYIGRQILPFEIVNGTFVVGGANVSESAQVHDTLKTAWERIVTYCFELKEPQHVLFQIANGFFLVACFTSDTPPGVLAMHALLMIGYLLYSTWAWNIICAPDIFSWAFAFTLLNMSHVVHSLYRLRPVSFASDLEPVYRKLFQPLGVSRITFKKLVSSEYAQINSLHYGEPYALQNITRADRLSLLLSGKAEAISDRTVLHAIESLEFLDSPEYESNRGALKEKFRVSIVAVSSCRCITWQRSSLEYLLVKETHLATVFSLLVARDVTSKIYQMNKKLAVQKGILLDIRLPGLIEVYPKLNDESEGSVDSSQSSPPLKIVPPGADKKENGIVSSNFIWK